MNFQLKRGALVVVFGGAGFVGRYAVRAMAKKGWRVRVAVRRPDLAGHLQPMGAVGQIQAVQANVRYPESVRAAIAGADAVVNLAAVLMPSGRQTFRAIHVEGAKTVARMAAEAGVRNFVQLSAIGADAQSDSDYARSRAMGDKLVLEALPTAVILRSSLVFGTEDEFFNRFAGMALTSPVLPLVGGKTRMQPVFVGDLAAAIVNACDGHAEHGSIYEIGGPEVHTFRALLEKTMTWAGRERVLLPLPSWAAKLIALLTWPLPNALRPLTVDQVRLLQRDNVVSDDARRNGRELRTLGVLHPQPIGIVVPQYLERFRPRGQFSQYRS